MRDSKLRDWFTIIIAAAALAVSLFIEKTHNDVETASRVTALESHRADDNARLDRIEDKVDRLLEWAMNKSKKDQ